MTEKQVSREQIKEARKLDLLSFLQQYEPNELVKIAPGVYSTRSYDSVKISKGKWYRWSRGYGGVSALDYLVKVREMDFVSAVRYLCDLSKYIPENKPQSFLRAPNSPTPFVLPPGNKNNDRVIQYLLARGIHSGLIRSCINTGRVYEDTRHNCVFVGFDEHDNPCFAFVRSSDPNSTFMHEVSGSNKMYSFSLPPQKNSVKLNVFESAIDTLSYVSLELMCNYQWKADHYLDLSGIYQPRKNVYETPIPIALAAYLQNNGQIKSINLCFDNDNAGKLAAQSIIALLRNKYEVQYTPPKFGKDYNEQLMAEKGLSGVKTRRSKTNIIQEEKTR